VIKEQPGNKGGKEDRYRDLGSGEEMIERERERASSGKEKR